MEAGPAALEANPRPVSGDPCARPPMSDGRTMQVGSALLQWTWATAHSPIHFVRQYKKGNFADLRSSFTCSAGHIKVSGVVICVLEQLLQLDHGIGANRCYALTILCSVKIPEGFYKNGED